MKRARIVRRLAAVLCGVALTCGGMSMAQADDLTAKKVRVDAQVNQAQSDIDVSTVALQQANQRVTEAKEKLTQAQDALQAAEDVSAKAADTYAAAQDLDQQMAVALDQANTELADAQSKEAEGKAAVDAQQDAIGEYARSIYQDSLPLVSVASLFGATSTQDLANRIQWTDTVLNTNERTLSELRVAQAQLSTARAAKDQAQEKADKAKADSDAQVQATKAAKVEADQATQGAQDARDAVQAALTEQESAQTAAQSALEEDKKQLADLKAEQDRVAAEIAERARKAAEEEAARQAAAKAAGASGNSSSTASSSGLIRPVNGPVTAGFGYRIHPIYHTRSFHDGTDFGVACGTPVRASAAGTVTSTYYNWSYGNRVFIDHGYINGKFTMTSYSHLQRWIVSPGQKVAQGQIVAYAGRTGTATGCHVHLSVYINGQSVNPLAYV